MNFTKILAALCWALVLGHTHIAAAWQLPVTPYQVQYHFMSGELTTYELGDILTIGDGTPVHSIGNGRVVAVGYKNDPGNIGGYVIVEMDRPHNAGLRNDPLINHETHLTAIYGHLGPHDENNPQANDILVHVGQDVNDHTIIGYVGDESENGGFSPRLFLGIQRGQYQGDRVVCERWNYAAYTMSNLGPNDACTCEMHDRWINPSVLLHQGEGAELAVCQDRNAEPNPADAAQDSAVVDLDAALVEAHERDAAIEIRDAAHQADTPDAMAHDATQEADAAVQNTPPLPPPPPPVNPSEGNAPPPAPPTQATPIQEPNAPIELVDGGIGRPPLIMPDAEAPEPIAPPSGADQPIVPPQYNDDLERAFLELCHHIPEECDGIDNNCDGQVDEHVVLPCETACGSGERQCENGLYTACDAPRVRSETCDGVDNDCDGQTDEDTQVFCMNFCGHLGVTYCQNGTLPVCEPEPCGGIPASIIINIDVDLNITVNMPANPPQNDGESDTPDDEDSRAERMIDAAVQNDEADAGVTDDAPAPPLPSAPATQAPASEAPASAAPSNPPAPATQAPAPPTEAPLPPPPPPPATQAPAPATQAPAPATQAPAPPPPPAPPTQNPGAPPPPAPATQSPGLPTAPPPLPGNDAAQHGAANDALVTPTLVAPNDNVAIESADYASPMNIALVWNPVPGAAVYDYEVRYSGFLGANIAHGTTPDTQFVLNWVSQSFGAELLWRVRAVNAQNVTSNWSAYRHFTPTYPVNTIVQCVSNDCPVVNATYLITNRLRNQGDLPSMLELQFVSGPCRNNRDFIRIPFSSLTSYVRRNDFNGCP